MFADLRVGLEGIGLNKSVGTLTELTLASTGHPKPGRKATHVLPGPFGVGLGGWDALKWHNETRKLFHDQADGNHCDSIESMLSQHVPPQGRVGCIHCRGSHPHHLKALLSGCGRPGTGKGNLGCIRFFTPRESWVHCCGRAAQSSLIGVHSLLRGLPLLRAVPKPKVQIPCPPDGPNHTIRNLLRSPRILGRPQDPEAY